MSEILAKLYLMDAKLDLILARIGVPAPVPTPEPEPGEAWANWWTKPKSEWPSEVDGQPVGYIYLTADTPLQVIHPADMTFGAYESEELRGQLNTAGKRIIAKTGYPIMVYARGNQYAEIKDKDVRPFYDWSIGGERRNFNGGTVAYLVMREQIKDGIPLWEGLPGDENGFVSLFMPSLRVQSVYNPRSGGTS